MSKSTQTFITFGLGLNHRACASIDKILLQKDQEPAITLQAAPKKAIDLKLPQEASVYIYKASQKAYKNALKHKEYHILADLWKNCINSYLTVRKFLFHPNAFKLLNGWHPVMEKKNMMLLTEEWRKGHPPPPKQVPKTVPVDSSSNSNMKKQPQAQKKGKCKAPARATGCHRKCISDGQNNDGIKKEGRSQI
ncbi:hypothetical protein O181_027481 [Austropuccinia psidii MF-1]|uniref:Uncharacterized protein n=1 Tax=Austropuccinia psidii MF-1 TaxID=1389203 RepID=A0A9Q3H1H5_9BASI|nr:hypothetical protein [Austropuccinia psidii MF-1]